MRKFISLVLCICMILAMGVQSFAEDKTVMTVTFVEEGSLITSDFSSFKKGWTQAIKFSMNKAFSDVTVTLKEDWVAENGEFDSSFINDTGFSWDAIEFPEGCNITVDLNGHTIDRGLTEWEYNGEVMCVLKETNVTIKNGTIKGGYSSNGGSGIHVKGGNLYLEDVNIVDNKSEDDDGIGIAVHGGTVTMVGGSIENNKGFVKHTGVWGGAIAVFGGNVTLRNVSIKNNAIVTGGFGAMGGAIYVGGGSLDAEYCDITNNLADTYGGAIRMDGGNVTLKHCDISKNQAGYYGGAIDVCGGMLTMEKCNIFKNTAGKDADGIRHNKGNALITGCYYEGSFLEEVEEYTSPSGVVYYPVVWKDMSDTMIDHSAATGSIVGSGNTALVVVAVAVTAAAVVAVVAIRRKKTAAPEEKAPSEE